MIRKTESRQVEGITRVILRDYGQLHISQGDNESLSIEGPEELLKMVQTTTRDHELILDIHGGWFDKAWRAITSTFEGKPLKYFLSVKELTGVYVSGAARVKIVHLKTNQLSLILKGAGEIIIPSLKAEHLEVELPGAGIISLAGQVIHQQVTIKGAGSYDTPKLESKEGKIFLKGVGRATVWVTDHLDATVDGVGSIDYYGDPITRKRITGLGKINRRTL